MKTLRHPSFVTYVDSIETETHLKIATEPVVPLREHLEVNKYSKLGRSHYGLFPFCNPVFSHVSLFAVFFCVFDRNMLAISWGIHQIAKAIEFLVKQDMTHSNICLGSIFVDSAGEWKLGGLELLQRGSDDAAMKVALPTPLKYAPPDRKSPMKKGHPWSIDMWGFGCLIWEVFNGELSRPEKLTEVSKIPKKLLAPFVKLIGANPSSRPSPTVFIEEARSNGKYLDNDFVNATFFLEEITLKSEEETNQFYSKLPGMLDGFPRSVCINKLLPQLLQAFHYGGAGSAVLGPLFKIGNFLGPEEYQEKIVPCVLKLFSSTDRVTRISLLRSLPIFIEHLSHSLVSEKIFPSIATGFTDSVPAMREESVKSMLLVVPRWELFCACVSWRS
eukprot:m.753721 g.753721  ORF g.753721 m.753721 type:complete len:388 (+) comp23173_c0_seq11:614-1777(+)